MTASSSVLLAPTRSPADVRRRLHVRLAERFDPARLRHKPLSLVRADARRQVEQILDTDGPVLARPDRDRLVEDVLAALPGAGPLEELFRDDAVTEILVLGPALVVAHRHGEWVPTSTQYRDAGQVRAVAARYAESGVPLQPGSPASGVVDVRLASGFRVVAVLPPEVLNVCPTLHLTRGPAVAGPAGPAGRGSGVVATPAPVGSRVAVTPAPVPIGSRTGSGVMLRTARPMPAGDEVVSLAAAPPPSGPASGPMSPARSSASGRLTSASGVADPYARLKQRMTENIILRLASAGVYDLNQVPLPELRKFVTLAVGEFCVQEAITSDPDFEQRLGLEILAAMNR